MEKLEKAVNNVADTILSFHKDYEYNWLFNKLPRAALVKTFFVLNPTKEKEVNEALNLYSSLPSEICHIKERVSISYKYAIEDIVKLAIYNYEKATTKEAKNQIVEDTRTKVLAVVHTIGKMDKIMAALLKGSSKEKFEKASSVVRGKMILDHANDYILQKNLEKFVIVQKTDNEIVEEFEKL